MTVNAQMLTTIMIVTKMVKVLGPMKLQYIEIHINTAFYSSINIWALFY